MQHDIFRAPELYSKSTDEPISHHQCRFVEHQILDVRDRRRLLAHPGVYGEVAEIGAAPRSAPSRPPPRRCRRSPVSIPRSIAGQPRIAQLFALPRELTTQGSAAMASTACPTHRGVYRFRTSGGAPFPRAGSSSRISATVPACAPSTRTQHRHDDGVHSGRRAADGNASWNARSRA